VLRVLLFCSAITRHEVPAQAPRPPIGGSYPAGDEYLRMGNGRAGVDSVADGDKQQTPRGIVLSLSLEA